MKVELVSMTKGVGKYADLNVEEIIAAIARHGVIKNDHGQLVKYLMKHGHWSPLDMVNFTFEIETSRAIGRQILRHSSLKPQEFSQRYSDAITFEPIELRKEHPQNRQSSMEVFNPMITVCDIKDQEDTLHATNFIRDTLDTVYKAYRKLIDAGVAKECARMILPECTSSILSFNGSLRSWLSFLNVRMEEHAQKEIRLIAEKIGILLEKELPVIFCCGLAKWILYVVFYMCAFNLI